MCLHIGPSCACSRWAQAQCLTCILSDTALSPQGAGLGAGWGQWWVTDQTQCWTAWQLPSHFTREYTGATEEVWEKVGPCTQISWFCGLMYGSSNAFQSIGWFYPWLFHVERCYHFAVPCWSEVMPLLGTVPHWLHLRATVEIICAVLPYFCMLPGVLLQRRPCCWHHVWGKALGTTWRLPAVTWWVASQMGCWDVRAHCLLSPLPARVLSGCHSGQAGIPCSLLCVY